MFSLTRLDTRFWKAVTACSVHPLVRRTWTVSLSAAGSVKKAKVNGAAHEREQQWKIKTTTEQIRLVFRGLICGGNFWLIMVSRRSRFDHAKLSLGIRFHKMSVRLSVAVCKDIREFGAERVGNCP